MLAECKFNVKKNGVTVTLIKKDKSESWTDLKPKKSMLNEDKKYSKNKGEGADGGVGDLMGMM